MGNNNIKPHLKKNTIHKNDLLSIGKDKRINLFLIIIFFVPVLLYLQTLQFWIYLF